MTPASATLSVDRLHVRHRGSPRPAIRDVSFTVAPGHTLAVVGPSGAGKSTLLRTIAGLLRPQSGAVQLDGADLLERTPQARRIALVFQSDALFAHMSVRANLAFALRNRRDRARVDALAETLDISQHLGRMPAMLSGGERQRVSIARALLSDPAALLLDEPLAHLDPELRARVRNELLGVREQFGGPIVYVTHDHAEALAIADQLLVLIDGSIADSGEPQRVYDAPRTLRAASFLGDRPMNLLHGLETNVVLGIRPEYVRLGGGSGYEGTVLRRERTGPDVYVYVQTGNGVVVARVSPSAQPSAGERTMLHFDPQHIRRYDSASGKVLP